MNFYAMNSIHFYWLLFKLKLVYQFKKDLKDIDTRLTKAWTSIDRLSIIWKSDLTDKMKRSFSQTAVVSILLYGCTTWTLTKRLEKKLDSNYTRMLQAILNKSWRQHPTKHQLYGHLTPITKTIQVRRTGHAGHSYGPPHMALQKQDDQLEHTCSSYVRIRDIALKTCQRRWSGISVLAARHDDDDIQYSKSSSIRSRSRHFCRFFSYYEFFENFD